MKRSAFVAAFVAAFVLLNAPAAADEEVDKILKELADGAAKLKSYTSKMKMTTDLDYGETYKQKAESVGTYEWARKGETYCMRSESKSKDATTQDGKTTKTTTMSTMVCDGEWFWALTETDGKKTVMKSRVQPGHDWVAALKQMQKDNKIERLPDETIDGEDCYVLKLTPKAAPAGQKPGHTLSHYQKSTAINVKMETFDANGKRMMSAVTTDVKVNVDISPQRFEFKVPEGAEVIDATQFEQQQSANEADQTEEDEAAEETEKADETKPEKKEKKGLKLPKRPKLP
ncbi:MAG: hypothetical protein KKB50_02020 [Planctomycetes bacterium]|nr:hypothetical protein [Planctomycetota bacterium]